MLWTWYPTGHEANGGMPSFSVCILGSIRVHGRCLPLGWAYMRDWKKCIWGIGFAGPWEYQIWTSSQRYLGKFCFLLQQDWTYTPGDKMVRSIWQCQGEAKWEMVGTIYQTFGLMTSAQLFWLHKQCNCLWATRICDLRSKHQVPHIDHQLKGISLSHFSHLWHSTMLLETLPLKAYK